jgi:hypothetical protein
VDETRVDLVESRWLVVMSDPGRSTRIRRRVEGHAAAPPF